MVLTVAYGDGTIDFRYRVRFSEISFRTYGSLCWTRCYCHRQLTVQPIDAHGNSWCCDVVGEFSVCGVGSGMCVCTRQTVIE